jgi:hypothetical protein
MRRRLQFSFCFPPIYGIYDTGNGKIYVFGDYDGEIEIFSATKCSIGRYRRWPGNEQALA